MLRPIEDPDEIRQAVRRRQEVAAGPTDFNEDWLREGHRVALAEETGRHIEDYEARGFVEALNSEGVQQLLAIANDPALVEEEVYKFEVSEKELIEFSSEFIGINVLVVPKQGNQLAVLFTTDDFRLIGGERNFLHSYVADLPAAKREFEEFAESHIDEMKPVLRRAAEYMSWIESSPK